MNEAQQVPNQLDIPLPALPGIEKGWELLLVEENRKSGLFTADKLAKDEQKRQTLLRALAEGMSIRSVANALGVSVNTVLAARKKWGAEIETLKQELGRDCLDVARLAAERIRDEIMEMPRQSLPIIMGVMVDKAQLLTGAPTARIQHEQAATIDDVADYIMSLPNVTPIQPVSAGESGAVKGAALIEGVAELMPELMPEMSSGEPVPALVAEVAGDSKSLVSAQSPEGTAENWADCGQDGQIEEGRK